MYADQVVAGTKRSIKDRLNGGGAEVDFGRARSTANGKRQRQNDDKWKHDLYEDNGPQTSKPKVGAKDLRFKLDRKVRQQAFENLRTSGVRDLREKLSGSMHAQPINNDPPNAGQTKQEVVKPVKKNVQSVKMPYAETKKVANPAPSRKKSQKKEESTVHGLLQSLGLEKYSITFQAEEVDMDALLHMNDDDLKALGIPMGPRKKILLTLNSKAQQ